MANILYANNAAGTLAAGLTNASTTLTLNAGQAALFPVPTPPQVFYVTLTDAATQTLIEIVQVTAVSGNVFSIVRAQDGTSALSWNAGDIVSQRTIALELRGFENAAEGLFGAQGVAITPSTTLGIKGTTTGDNANAGSVGEYLQVNNSGAVLVTSTLANVVSVTLSPGDWEVSGTVFYSPSGVSSMNALIASVSTTSLTVGSSPTILQLPFNTTNQEISTSVNRINVTTNTTAFLVAQCNFTGGTVNASAVIRARRVR